MSNALDMILSLNIKLPSAFYWVRKVRSTDISRCCAECLIGERESRMYHGTKGNQTPRFIEIDIKPEPIYKAYYLCGLSKGYVYENNTHIAFLHAPGVVLHAESEQMEVNITNAQRIHFESYIPNPPGRYTDYQRACRNWIFANLLRDDKVNEYIQKETM